MKWFLNMKISAKLITGFLVIAIVAAVVGVVGILSISNISQDDKQLYNVNTVGLGETGSAAVCFQQIRYDALKFLTLDDSAKSDMKAVSDDITAQTAKIKEALASSQKIIDDGENGTLLDKIQTEWDQYQGSLTKLVDSFINGDGSWARTNIPEIAKVGTTIREDYLALFDKIAAEAGVTAKGNQSAANSAIILMIIIAAACRCDRSDSWCLHLEYHR